MDSEYSRKTNQAAQRSLAHSASGATRAAEGQGYAEQAASLSPRTPLIDPESGATVGSYTEDSGVTHVFDSTGALVWIDELPLGDTISPIDGIFALRGLLAAAATVVKGAAIEMSNAHKAGGGALERRIPEFVWTTLRQQAGVQREG